jgi:hypothetical protein
MRYQGRAARHHLPSGKTMCSVDAEICSRVNSNQSIAMQRRAPLSLLVEIGICPLGGRAL